MRVIFKANGQVLVITKTMDKTKAHEMPSETAAKAFFIAKGVDNPGRFLREWEVAKEECDKLGHNCAEFGILGCFTISCLTDERGQEYAPVFH